MINSSLVLTVAGALFLSSPLRAQDNPEDEAPEAATTPLAADAARNKGYKAEETNPAVEHTEDDAPVERHGEPRTLFAAPPQRPLGAAERRAASSGGGAASGSGAGISCDKSDPPLTRVIRVERDFFSRDLPNSGRWALGPNEAISYKFTAPKSSRGGFSTDMGTNARSVSHMLTVSETPCDFDGTKAVSGRQVGPNEPRPKFVPCYDVGAPGGTINFATIGLELPPRTPTAHLCWIKPGKTYYFNIRTYLPFPNRDACAAEAKTFGANLKCGGIWGFIGGVADGAKKK